MNITRRHPLILALALLCGASAPAYAKSPAMTEKPSSTLRLATYNTSLYSDDAGGLIKELEGDSEHARKIAAVLQQVRPDLVLLNEFDFDDAHRAADLFQKRYLEVAQPGGGKPLHFAYRYLAPVNTRYPLRLRLSGNRSAGRACRSSRPAARDASPPPHTHPL